MFTEDNNTLDIKAKLKRSQDIDEAIRKCSEILKCSVPDVPKRIQKLATQLKQCEEIIGALNG